MRTGKRSVRSRCAGLPGLYQVDARTPSTVESPLLILVAKITTSEGGCFVISVGDGELVQCRAAIRNVKCGNDGQGRADNHGLSTMAAVVAVLVRSTAGRDSHF